MTCPLSCRLHHVQLGVHAPGCPDAPRMTDPHLTSDAMFTAPDMSPWAAFPEASLDLGPAPTQTAPPLGEPGKLLSGEVHDGSRAGSSRARSDAGVGLPSAPRERRGTPMRSRPTPVWTTPPPIFEPDASRALLFAAALFLVGFWSAFAGFVWLAST